MFLFFFFFPPGTVVEGRTPLHPVPPEAFLDSRFLGQSARTPSPLLTFHNGRKVAIDGVVAFFFPFRSCFSVKGARRRGRFSSWPTHHREVGGLAPSLAPCASVRLVFLARPFVLPSVPRSLPLSSPLKQTGLRNKHGP